MSNFEVSFNNTFHEPSQEVFHEYRHVAHVSQVLAENYRHCRWVVRTDFLFGNDGLHNGTRASDA
jgi:hypothetical protein